MVILVVAVGLAVTASVHAGNDTVRLQSPLDGTGSSTHETSLGDVVSDSARQAGDADISIVAADEIGSTLIAAGTVPVSKVVSALTYRADPTDTVVVLKLTGAQLGQVLERSVSRAPQGFDGFLQVSGLTLRYDPSKPEGSRITLLKVGDSPVDATHAYLIATTHPVADGSFGYFRLWSPTDVVRDTHTTLASGLTAYLSAQRSINAPAANRISP